MKPILPLLMLLFLLLTACGNQDEAAIKVSAQDATHARVSVSAGEGTTAKPVILEGPNGDVNTEVRPGESVVLDSDTGVSTGAGTETNSSSTSVTIEWDED